MNDTDAEKAALTMTVRQLFAAGDDFAREERESVDAFIAAARRDLAGALRDRELDTVIYQFARLANHLAERDGCVLEWRTLTRDIAKMLHSGDDTGALLSAEADGDVFMMRRLAQARLHRAIGDATNTASVSGWLSMFSDYAAAEHLFDAAKNVS